MTKLECGPGEDKERFLRDLLEQAQVLAKDETDQRRYAALSGLSIRARRLLKAESGDIPHAPNDSPSKLWADFSGVVNT